MAAIPAVVVGSHARTALLLSYVSSPKTGTYCSWTRVFGEAVCWWECSVRVFPEQRAHNSLQIVAGKGSHQVALFAALPDVWLLLLAICRQHVFRPCHAPRLSLKVDVTASSWKALVSCESSTQGACVCAHVVVL